MPAPKKYTQFIFDSKENSRETDPYGYLSLLFDVISDLTKIRIKKVITQHDLAKRSGLTQPTIARIESGRVNPTVMQLIKIAKALDHKIEFEPAKFEGGDYDGYLE